ncbi:PH domain-containing protein [Microbacterium sp. cx-59]|uniref:PH domain-containing protein n=1 Tax=Microbacterium sp. cx-59 TaxID=2891207 RepID=UPI001E29982E|nr:PH domain-containing protein [Microbacterium sp. cx-59]MCC4908438.1 PH domain-containing protein [Microbacterium sp. cx-59]
MTDAAAPVVRARSALSDGEWHRMHPLSPLLRGGLFLIVVLGFVVANLRERLIEIFLPGLTPGFRGGPPEDPIDYILGHDLVLLALLAVLGIVVVLVLLFWLSWRFHSFRITGDDVEVRSGVLFRSNRRAPLDRVQGVNLTRPLVARLIGLAKLEIVGAGLDANVRLEYLSTANAEAVRHDILRLASGRTLGEAAPGGTPRSWQGGAAASVMTGVTGIVDGAEEPVSEPASVVRIPFARLVGSVLLSDTTVALILVAIGAVVAMQFWPPWLLFTLLPLVLGFGAYYVRSITRSLRYAIAPTPHGVRIVFGLFTTVTEILPPGRVHAVQVRQPLLWRPAGWWTITVNRLSGTSSGQEAAAAFTHVLPVGTRADAERVVALLLPWLDADERALIFDRGVLAASADDPYTTTPPRGRVLRPISWRRNGLTLSPTALFLRRGRIVRSLVIVPLARAQSIAVHQGPIYRMLRLARIRAHTVAGTVDTGIGAIDRADALALFAGAEARAIASAATDRSHRWDADADLGTDAGAGADLRPDADAGADAGTDAGASASVPPSERTHE